MIMAKEDCPIIGRISMRSIMRPKMAQAITAPVIPKMILGRFDTQSSTAPMGENMGAFSRAEISQSGSHFASQLGISSNPGSSTAKV